MFVIFKYALVFITLFTNYAVARNGCRRCNGQKVITFKDYVTLDQLNKYVDASLGDGCATGNQFAVQGRALVQGTCLDEMPQRCKQWKVGFVAWRYCGNGGLANFTRRDKCLAGICAATETTTLYCDKSVDCQSTCHMNLCV